MGAFRVLTDPEWQLVDPDPPEQPAVQEGDLQLNEQGKQKENFRSYLKARKKKNFNNGVGNNGMDNNGMEENQYHYCSSCLRQVEYHRIQVKGRPRCLEAVCRTDQRFSKVRARVNSRVRKIP